MLIRLFGFCVHLRDGSVPQQRSQCVHGEELIMVPTDLHIKHFLNMVTRVSNKATIELSSFFFFLTLQKLRMVQLLHCFHKWHKVKFFPHTPALPSFSVLEECQCMECVLVDANCTIHTHTHILTHTQPHPILLKPIHSPTGIVICGDKIV